MNTVIFVIIVLVAGALAGLVQGTVNFIIVEPYLDQAIGLENERLFAVGQENTPEFQAEYEGYRAWQKGGQVFASVILGVSIGSLFGIVYYLTRKRLPGGRYITKSIALAATMGVVLYLIPFLKYPAVLPGTGSEDTLALRTMLYIGFVIMSGVGAIACYKIVTSLKKHGRVIGPIVYVALVSCLFIVMPSNAESTDIPREMVDGFRMMSVIGVFSFWITNGLLLGILWNKLEPEKTMHL